MPPRAQLEKAKCEITDFFQFQDVKVLSRADLRQILDFHGKEWGLPASVTLPKFSAFLIEEVGLRMETCSFSSRVYTRFTVGEVPLYEFLLALIPNSYLSHYTALFLHQLTERIPDRIYLNFPQERKVRKNLSLDHTLIDRAFQRSVRISKNSALFRGHSLLLLNSMGQGDLGIINLEEPEGARVRVTDMERTLVDIVVRPVYSGGVSNVLAAYRKARGKVSIGKLAETLKALDFAYPFHQSIGFCLERSGYKDSEIALVRNFPIEYDFYLDYQMVETDYSRDWRLYFPKRLE